MKRLLASIIVVALTLSLVACSKTESDNDKPAEIPYKTCQAIEEEIAGYFSEHGGKVYVFGDKGVLTVSMFMEGQASKAPFADFANALVVKAKEIAEEYELGIGSIELMFSAGENDFLKWSTSDCVSGQLGDTYNGAAVFLNSQTIQDLVDRYGAMNWFYELAPESTPAVNFSPETIVFMLQKSFTDIPVNVSLDGSSIALDWQVGNDVWNATDSEKDSLVERMTTVYNATRNAVDISGGTDLTISLNAVDDDGNVYVSVSDDGAVFHEKK